MSVAAESSREPLRAVVTDLAGFNECLGALRSGSGPIAFDAERAHGHRYLPKAYLFQIRRQGAGTWLIDPIPFESQPAALSQLVGVAPGELWLIHAASQDLPCMRDVGIYPDRLFDTELAARLLGEPAVGLQALLEAKVGISLRKAHSSANWSTRPLPESWLIYAALDVDYLIELYESLHRDLTRMRRLEWLEQECAAVLEQFHQPPPPPAEPWRKLSHITSLKTPLQLAVARELWCMRDSIAEKRDRPPSRIVSDEAIVELAMKARNDSWPTREDLFRIEGFKGRPAIRWSKNWIQAVQRAAQLPESHYPTKRPPSEGIPRPKHWGRSNPEAAQRWATVKPLIDDLACDIGIQPSLLAPPAPLQHVLWSQANPTKAHLLTAGMRPWQAEFLAALLTEALARVHDGQAEPPLGHE